MAKVVAHDLREYSLFTGPLTVSDSGTLAFMPIPASGVILRVAAACNIEPDASPDITFELNGFELQTAAGTTATIGLNNADLVGTVQTVEMGPSDPANFANGIEDGDALAARAVLEIVSDGAGTAGSYGFMITVGP